jgi:hypothetical protein
MRSAIRFFYINVVNWKDVSLETIEVANRAQRTPELLSRILNTGHLEVPSAADEVVITWLRYM